MTASVQFDVPLDHPLPAGAGEDLVHAQHEALAHAARHGQVWPGHRH
jgi:hypothetical protein